MLTELSVAGIGPEDDDILLTAIFRPFRLLATDSSAIAVLIGNLIPFLIEFVRCLIATCGIMVEEAIYLRNAHW